MQVTQEDGGKLNAFANEPRMVVMEPGEAPRSNGLLLIGGRCAGAGADGGGQPHQLKVVGSAEGL
jgi:hypothetical protein